MGSSKTVPDAENKTTSSEPARTSVPIPERDVSRHLSRRYDPRFRLFLIIGLIAWVIVGFFLWRYFASYESTDDAQIDGHVNSISARVSGHVISLRVQDNQYVEAGTLLAEIDPADYQVIVQRAEADYDDARATADAASVDVPIISVNTTSQLSSAEADVRSAQAGIKASRQQFEAAKANLQQAEANHVKAQNDLARYKQLVDKQEISQQQFDQAVAAARASAAEVEAARATADAAQAQIAQAEGKLAQAEASQRYASTGPKQLQVTRAKAQSAQAAAMRKKADLDQALLNLKYTKIVAPVTGLVSNRTVEVGQNVSVGQELMKVIPLDEQNIWVTANFKETQLRDMKPGQKVTVYVDATGKKYRGHVDSLPGASGARFSLLPPENATGNYVKVVQRFEIKILFELGENKDHALRPGMSVEPKVW